MTRKSKEYLLNKNFQFFSSNILKVLIVLNLCNYRVINMKDREVLYRIRRVTISEKADRTYIALENEKGKTAGTLNLRGKQEGLIGMKEVKILGGE